MRSVTFTETFNGTVIEFDKVATLIEEGRVELSEGADRRASFHVSQNHTTRNIETTIRVRVDGD